MFGAGARPRQTFIDVGLDERTLPVRLVEQGRAHVDEILHRLRLGVEPAFAMIAEIVASRAVNPADHDLALGDLERRGRIAFRKREGTRSHALAIAAVTSHRQQRRVVRLEPHLPATTATLPGSHASTGLFTSATIFFAASPRSLAGTIASQVLGGMALHCWALVIFDRATT